MYRYLVLFGGKEAFATSCPWSDNPAWQVILFALGLGGNFLLIYVCNFHVLNHLLFIYICKLHWNRDLVRPRTRRLCLCCRRRSCGRSGQEEGAVGQAVTGRLRYRLRQRPRCLVHSPRRSRCSHQVRSQLSAFSSSSLSHSHCPHFSSPCPSPLRVPVYIYVYI